MSDLGDMGAGGFDPNAVDPFDDGGFVPASADDEIGADADFGTYDDTGISPDGEDAGEHHSDVQAIEALCAFGGPLQVTPDPVADAELEQWLAGPEADGLLTHAQLAELDQLLRARLARE
jgi:hypothetical protein